MSDVARRALLRRFGTVSLALPLGPLLAACAVAEATAQRYTVQMIAGNQFDPPGLTVPKGALVSWKNVGSLPHTATDDPSKAARSADAVLPRGAQPWDSGDLYPGAAWSHVFDVPGEYAYFCRYHEDQQMIGTITVLESGAQPTASPGKGAAEHLLSPKLPPATPPPAEPPAKTPLPTPPGASPASPGGTR